MIVLHTSHAKTQRGQRRKEIPASLLCVFAPFASLREIPILALILAGISLSSSLGQTRRPFAPADILRVATVSDPQISPNGEWVVYTVSTTSGDRTGSTLWLARTRLELPDPPTSTAPPTRRPDRDWREIARPPSQLLPSSWAASTPRWSPDSNRIAFLANRDDQNGIWVVNLNKPEPRLVAPVQSTNFFISYAGESFAWSPDSKRIAYISAGEELSETVRKPDDPRVIDRIQYKSRASFSDDRRTHVWMVEVDKPEPRQLTSGPFYDHAVTFSTRGDEIGFLSNHEPDPEANNNSDIFAVDFGGQVRQITQTKGCEYEPIWSPDGKWIAYSATKRDVTTIDSVAEDTHVWVIAASGGAGRELTNQQDRRARGPSWSPDSRSILFLAGDRGKTTIFRVRLDTRRIDRLSTYYFDGQLGATLDDRDSESRPATESALEPDQSFQIASFTIADKTLPVTRASGARESYLMPFALTLSDPMHPSEVWIGLGSGVPLRRLSAHNDSLRSFVGPIAPEEINFRSFDGTPVQGWLMKPVSFREDRKYPLILSVHGGPHGMSGWGFNATFQAYASRGYAVLYLNPRGSSGYGQKFSDGTLSEWGGGDYKDLMAGVDEALRRYSWIDQSRMGVTGGSYGGFMTNWIITQTPRFKAAVASASVSNLVSFYSTSLYQDLIHVEFGGFPWDNYEQLWQWSPLRYVRQAQTPTLFIHGEQDNDVHITQAEEMYMALKRRGVETVFVRYPREGHGLREPRHRVDALERTLAWFDRFLK
jgi:dipeptidyl aminopeptidase/acylaminoacyl peptidase